MFVVVVEDERGGLVAETALFEGSISIGRTSENDLVLDAPTISRHHARLSLESTGVVLHDLGSANGVVLDDHPLTGSSPITESSRVRLGGYRLYIERATGRMRAPQDGLSTAIVTAEQAHGKLVLTDGAQAGRELMLFERIACIGRTDENDITLADTSVSRHHARLKKQDDGSYTLMDLNSSNGTRLNGKRVTSARARFGDRIHFGNVPCLLVDPKGKGAARAQTPRWVAYAGAVLAAAGLGALLSFVLR
ncbi:MAG: FHA domain-containing protein [Bradymonadia bacterium]